MTELSFEATSKFADTEKGRIHYHEAGTGPALLMIHGSGPGVTGWANFGDNLAFFSEHFRCLIIDLPGYGKSDAVEGIPVPVCVEGCWALLDALGINKVDIIGNSLGAMVGGFMAAYQQARVGKLVAIGGLGMNIYSPFPGQGLTLLSEFVEDPTRERIRSWLNSMVYDQSLVTDEMIDQRFEAATEPKTMATSKMLYSKESLAALAEQFRGPDAAQRIAHLPLIQAPTLLTWGRDDRVTPLDLALVPMRMIPNCELHVFPDCGHWSMIEAKSAFQSLTLSFLQRED
jgi:2-hydroxy-6-oxonona-2,4-dienedioate hydrolase